MFVGVADEAKFVVKRASSTLLTVFEPATTPVVGPIADPVVVIEFLDSLVAERFTVDDAGGKTTGVLA